MGGTGAGRGLWPPAGLRQAQRMAGAMAPARPPGRAEPFSVFQPAVDAVCAFSADCQAPCSAQGQARIDTITLLPGLVSGSPVFLSGMTGSGLDGTIPEALEDQFRRSVEKIGAVLRRPWPGFDQIVELTRFRVGLRDPFERFSPIPSHHVQDPCPAWTPAEVAGLRREGVVVDIKPVAAASGLTRRYGSYAGSPDLRPSGGNSRSHGLWACAEWPAGLPVPQWCCRPRRAGGRAGLPCLPGQGT